MGEAAFDELDGSRWLRGWGGLWGEEEVDVVGHDDEGVEAVVALGAVVLEGFEEELGVGRGLEETAAVGSLGADEGGAVDCEAGGLAHGGPSVPQRLKPGNASEVGWHG